MNCNHSSSCGLRRSAVFVILCRRISLRDNRTNTLEYVWLTWAPKKVSKVNKWNELYLRFGQIQIICRRVHKKHKKKNNSFVDRFIFSVWNSKFQTAIIRDEKMICDGRNFIFFFVSQFVSWNSERRAYKRYRLAFIQHTFGYKSFVAVGIGARTFNFVRQCVRLFREFSTFSFVVILLFFPLSRFHSHKRSESHLCICRIFLLLFFFCLALMWRKRYETEWMKIVGLHRCRCRRCRQ